MDSPVGGPPFFSPGPIEGFDPLFKPTFHREQSLDYRTLVAPPHSGFSNRHQMTKCLKIYLWHYRCLNARLHIRPNLFPTPFLPESPTSLPPVLIAPSYTRTPLVSVPTPTVPLATTPAFAPPPFPHAPVSPIFPGEVGGGSLTGWPPLNLSLRQSPQRHSHRPAAATPPHPPRSPPAPGARRPLAPACDIRVYR